MGFQCLDCFPGITASYPAAPHNRLGLGSPLLDPTAATTVVKIAFPLFPRKQRSPDV